MNREMKRYALVLNPDDFLYAEPIYRFLHQCTSQENDQNTWKIDSIYIFPTKGTLKSQFLHLWTGLALVGWVQALSAWMGWAIRAIPAKWGERWGLTQAEKFWIESAARRFQIPVYRFKNVNEPAFREWIRERKINTILNICSQIYKKQAIESLPPIYNFHGGYVPGNAGRYPSFWAHRKGLAQILSAHRVNEKIDDGPAVLHHPLRSGPDISVYDLMIEMLEVFPSVLIRTIQLIESHQQEVLPKEFEPFYGPRPTAKEIAEYHREVRRARQRQK